MQFHNKKIIAPLIFGTLFLAVGVSAYTIGRMHAESDFRDGWVKQELPVRLAGGIVGTWGGDHIFYSTYCGSSCLGFEVRNLTTGRIQKGSLGFMNDDKGNAYTLFEDWNGDRYRFAGEFVSVRGREHGQKRILDFSMNEKIMSEPTIHSLEY